MRPDPAAAEDCKSTPGKNVPYPEPLDATKPPPIDRYCDLVLTGGVVNGVVYPWAIVEIARAHRFKNIGGTSVGAMAAALTAAAEYSRRRGDVSGFNEVLLQLPCKLGENVTRKGQRKGRTRIFTLFQPETGCQRLFDMFVRIFSKGGLSFGPAPLSPPAGAAGKNVSADTPKRLVAARDVFGLIVQIGKLLWQVPSAYRSAAWRGIAFAAGLSIVAVVLHHWLLGTGASWSWPMGVDIAVEFLWIGLPWAFLFMLLFIMGTIYHDLMHKLVPNGFGICTGAHGDGVPPDEPSLVEWLHEGIQGAARKPLDQPLTFKDLWDAPGGPNERPRPAARRIRKPRSINLQMVTTNLTLGRPYGLPLEDETSRLFFKAEELAKFFPKEIIEHLKKHSKQYKPVWCEDPPEAGEADILELPTGELPVVVAARLSLSFPVLFSAVPLWAIDYEPRLADGKRKLRRCRFSDGGICSNFPIHLFDAAIPEWPTFGISLGTRSIFRKDQFVWLPKLHYQGRGDCWNRFDDEKSPVTGEKVLPLYRLLGFISSLVFSAKDWNDRTSMRMPGVRDRVVRIFLESGGELDLKLTAQDIMDYAGNYGRPAGQALVDKFIDRCDNSRPSSAWNEHRWVRFNTFLVGLRERIEALRTAAQKAAYCTPLSRQIPGAITKRPLEGTDAAGMPLAGSQAQDLENLLSALEDMESAFAQAALPQPYKPEPPPSLHIRPPL